MLSAVKSIMTADFTDSESVAVLATASIALARELGREAAREHFARLVRKS
jgi:hypothetical protein